MVELEQLETLTLAFCDHQFLKPENGNSSQRFTTNNMID